MTAVASRSTLETRLAELLMTQLLPCDHGDGIEVVHDVESVEVELQCDLDDDAPVDAATAEAALAVVRAPAADDPETTIKMLKFWFETNDDLIDTSKFVDELMDELLADDGTRRFERQTAPYERIEIQVDPTAFMRATIEEAKTVQRSAR